MDRASMLLLAACLLCSGVAHVAARNPHAVSIADAAMGRRLQQADECGENPFDRETRDGEPCCFPFSYSGQQRNDCIVEADRLWCVVEPLGSLVECKPQGTGVQEVDTSAVEAPPPGDEDDEDEDEGGSTLSDEVREQLQSGLAALQVRYTIDDRRCSFPADDPSTGDTVSDCFPMADGEDMVAYDESSQREYCFPVGDGPEDDDGDGVGDDPVQCAARGYEPGGAGEAPEGTECLDKDVTAETVSGRSCSFPQLNTRIKGWVCGCYTIHNDADDVSYDEGAKYYCSPDGDETGGVEECAAGAPLAAESVADITITPEGLTPDEDEDEEEEDKEEAAAAAKEEEEDEAEEEEEEQEEEEEEEGSDTASQSTDGGDGDDDFLYYDDGGSDTGLIVGLAVGIPCGIAAIAAVAGGGYWYMKKRPGGGGATSFSKFQGDDPVRGGAVSSAGVAKPGSGLADVSSYSNA